VLLPRALRPRAKPGLDRPLADVSGEVSGVFACIFAALPQQPVVGIGAHARHPAERALLLDDDRVQAIIEQPQRAGHACGPAADDRNDGRL
jgi:hypothetical protein